MSPHFIPQSDSQKLGWMQVFANGISDRASAYQLSASDAASIAAAVDRFAQAYYIATDPARRTKVTVNLKDTARNSAEAICRQYAAAIKINAGISDADKIAVGVRPVNSSRPRINAPQTSPVVDVIAATPKKHNLRYQDSMSSDSSAKPFGAAQLQLFRAIADEPITDPEQAQFLRAYTRNPIEVDFTAKDGGKVATYFARWSSPRGELGPWSAPTWMHIAA